MSIYKNFLFLFVFLPAVLSCESKSSYDIESDKMITDLNLEIKSLDDEYRTLVGELEKVSTVLNDQDIDTEIRKSIKKELLEGEDYKKQIDQWLSYLKMKRKIRHKSLIDRKNQKNLSEQAKEEIEAYFIQKKAKPIDRPWLKRYRTAIEL